MSNLDLIRSQVQDIDRDCKAWRLKKLQELVDKVVRLELDEEHKQRLAEVAEHQKTIAALKEERDMLKATIVEERNELKKLYSENKDHLVDKIVRLKQQLDYYRDLNNVYPCYDYQACHISHLLRARSFGDAQDFIQKHDNSACISDSHCQRIDVDERNKEEEADEGVE